MEFYIEEIVPKSNNNVGEKELELAKPKSNTTILEKEVQKMKEFDALDDDTIKEELKRDNVADKLTKEIDNLTGNRIYLDNLLRQTKLNRNDFKNEDLETARENASDDWKIIFSGKIKDYIVAIDRVIEDSLSGTQISSRNADNQYINWFERDSRGMIHDDISASDTLKKFIPNLTTFHKNERSKHNSPAEFAIQFLKTFGRIPDHKVRTMKFVAAFKLWFIEGNWTICDVIDQYEYELKRVLKREKFQRSKDEDYFRRNEEWLNKMRKNCGCNNESSFTRKKRKNKEDRRARRAEQKRKEKAKKEEENRKKEEKERVLKEKIRRQNDVFIKLLLNKPDSSTTNFDEFKYAVTNFLKNPDLSGEKSRSAVFASCYRNKYKSIHAKLYSIKKYTSIFWYIDEYIKEFGNKQINSDELIIKALESIDFEEDQIAGLL
jgi:hypothetical protein